MDLKMLSQGRRKKGKKPWPPLELLINTNKQEKSPIVAIYKIIVCLQKVIEKCQPNASITEICAFGDSLIEAEVFVNNSSVKKSVHKK
jgi:hypothetical protein